MKKIYSKKSGCILLLLILVSVSRVNAASRQYAPLAASDFNLTINNDVQVSDRILEFDISLLNVNTLNSFELATVQAGILVNNAIYNGGVITVTMVPGSSQLVNPPLSILFDQVTNAIKVTPKSGPGAGTGTILSTIGSGTKVCRVRITNTNAFTASTRANLTFNFTTVPYPTKVAQYITGTNTQLACDATNCYSTAANVILNVPPTPFAVSGSGSYCQGTAGIPVGLSNSEAGVIYTLYNGATALTPTVAGTGFTISFGDQFAGTYTVRGSNFGGTQDMTANAVITETPSLVAGVSIVSDQNNVCAGTAVTLTATPTNGGTAPSYQWYNGTTTVGTNSPTYFYTPANGDLISVVMTSNATPCLTGSPVTSNVVTLNVNPLLVAGVSIVSDQNNVCAGTAVTLTATPTNGGTTPSYQWYNGTTAVGINSPTYFYTPANGDLISVVMTSNATPCLTGSPVTSNVVTLNVNPLLVAGVSIVSDQNNVCAGTAVTLTATPTNGGTTPSYQWYNGTTAVGINSPTYFYTPANGDLISVVMTSNATPCLTGSPVTSNMVTMNVNALVPAGVSILSDANNVCDGTTVVFTATPVGGGSSPAYQWYKGSTPVGTNSPTYSYIPADGDAISVTMTSNSLCASGSPVTSNPVSLIVNPVIAASISISVSANPVNTGIPVTFTATPIGGGTSPVYQWYNGSTQVGTNLNTFTYTPSDGDVISTIMTSDAPCITGSPATSNQITMSVSIGTSVDQNKISLSVYSRDKNIYVDCSQHAKQIYIYNTLGTIVMMENNVTGLKEFNLNNYPVAYYYVRIVTEFNVFTRKILLK